MSIEFRCSQCDRLLRTGDDTAGRMAQCPQCGAQTQVPSPETTGMPSSSQPSGGSGLFESRGPEQADSAAFRTPYQTTPGHGPGPAYPGNTSYALKRVSAPAACLIVTAILGLVAQTLGLIDTIFKIGMIPVFHQKEIMPIVFEGPVATTQILIAMVMSIVVLIGAIKMKGLENYAFAIASSILSLIPCTSPCCCLGIPFGIWALVVLSDPVVKASFRN